LEIAVLAQRLAALAVEGEAGGVHEHGGEVGEQIAAAVKQPFLDQVLDTARRERPVRLLLQFLAEPGHGPIEVMQIEPLGAGDVVILHPSRAVAVGSGDEQPMQRGDKHGALDRKLERAILQQIVENRANPLPLPDSVEQHRPADPLRRNRQRPFGALIERADQQDLVGEPGPRGDERGERAGGGQFVGAAEIGDHSLADGGAVAPVLDDLDVTALAGRLEAEEHGRSPIEHHRIRLVAKYQAQKSCKRGTTI
jgi:hypothetical protein